MGKYTTAILLLAGVLVVGAAGTAALAASHEGTRATLDDAGTPLPDVVSMGEQLQSSLMAALPWVALVAVPLFILGVLATLTYTGGSSTPRRRY